MTWFRCSGGSGMPAGLQTAMDSVLNKKFGTSTTYPANGWPDDVNLLGPLPEKTVSGSIAHLEDGADTVPIKSWGVTLPASLDGYNSVMCVTDGENLAYISGTDTDNGYVSGQWVNSDGSTSLNANWTISEYLPIPSNTEMIISGLEGNFPAIAFYDASKTFISGIAYGVQTSQTFTTPSNAVYCRISFNSAMSSKVMLEKGSTASAYVTPTAPTTQTANLGRTIYGGNVNVIQGTGTETFGYIVFDGSEDEGWSNYGSYEGYSINIPTMKKGTRQDGVCNQLTDSKSSATGQTNAFWLGVNTQRFYVIGVYQSMGNTLEAFRTYLSSHPLILVYPLDTTTDFTFTPISVNSRYGVNNLWTDSGNDNQVKYYADIALALGYNKYRYLKWEITATRTTSSYVQMSMINFIDADNNSFTFPTGASVTSTTTATSGTSPSYIINGSVDNKFCGNWQSSGVTLTIDLGVGNVIDVTRFTKFQWYTANDSNDRDPYSWKLYGIDGSNAPHLLCSRDAYAVTTTRKALADTVDITLV